MKTALVIGTKGDVRIELFGNACKKHNINLTVIDYLDIANDNINLANLLTPDTLVRIESPGKSAQTELAILQLGTQITAREGKFTIASQCDIDKSSDKGFILPSRQWYNGYCFLLDKISAQLSNSAPHVMFNSVESIKLMFDKYETQRHLASCGIAIPKFLPEINSFEELNSQMRLHNMRRVFIKPRHSSSASGVVALETNGTRFKATTTVQIDGTDLYNSRNINTYTNNSQISWLIDRLAQNAIHVEEWIPKMNWGAKRCDLRLVVINGNAYHGIARLSHSPMTNLHLKNERRSLDEFVNLIGFENWTKGKELGQNAVKSLPGAYYSGVDVLFSSQYKPYILELNAFGDLLLNVTHNNHDTYEEELIQKLGTDL